MYSLLVTRWRHAWPRALHRLPEESFAANALQKATKASLIWCSNYNVYFLKPFLSQIPQAQGETHSCSGCQTRVLALATLLLLVTEVTPSKPLECCFSQPYHPACWWRRICTNSSSFRNFEFQCFLEFSFSVYPPPFPIYQTIVTCLLLVSDVLELLSCFIQWAPNPS